MVEVRGVEPLSLSISTMPSTCVVEFLSLSELWLQLPVRMHCSQFGDRRPEQISAIPVPNVDARFRLLGVGGLTCRVN